MAIREGIETGTHTNKQLLSQLLEVLVVPQDRDEPLESGKLAVYSEQEQHDEEEHSPEGSHGHVDQSLCEDHKGQTRALGYLMGEGNRRVVHS